MEYLCSEVLASNVYSFGVFNYFLLISEEKSRQNWRGIPTGQGSVKNLGS